MNNIQPNKPRFSTLDTFIYVSFAYALLFLYLFLANIILINRMPEQVAPLEAKASIDVDPVQPKSMTTEGIMSHDFSK